MLSEQQEVQPNRQSEISDFDGLYQPLSDNDSSALSSASLGAPETVPQLEDPDQFSTH